MKIFFEKLNNDGTQISLDIQGAVNALKALSNFLVLPVPPNFGIIEQSLGDEEYLTIDGDYRTNVGTRGLRKITIESFLPAKYYRWIVPGASAVPDVYIEFFESAMRDNQLVRLVITQGMVSKLVMICRVNFKKGISDDAGDVPYTLDLTEYSTTSSNKLGFTLGGLSI